jgi:hypothetical protein
MAFTKRLGGFGGVIFRSRGVLIIDIPSMGLTNSPNSGRGYEGQNLQTYLTSNYQYSVNTPGITINITIPVNYVLGGYAPSALSALNLNGFTELDTINIYNYGQIIGGGGAGGAGGTGNSSGSPGGNATSGILATSCLAPINLYNYGEIRGGGTGGGGGGGGTSSATGGTGGLGAGLNINSAGGLNQTYTLYGTPIGGSAGASPAGAGGSGGALESAGVSGDNGTFRSGGKFPSTFSTSGGPAGSDLGYAINGASRVTIIANTGTIGTTTG